MMKTLVLIRHAKSDWDNIDISDFDRPLNKRGLNDAPVMAAELKHLGIKPGLIITSSAVRALTTARIFASEFGYASEKIIEAPEIYHGYYKNYINIINETPKNIDCLLLFGHNPDISLTASQLLHDFSTQLPTAGCICIEFNIDDWIDIESVTGNLKFYTYPKKVNLTL